MSDAPTDLSAHPLLADLTENQRQAVTTTQGPLLVVAAAGSGKTRVITRRVAWLVQEVGVAPWNVCAITFTNKAAGEMRERVGELVSGRQASALTISTFHALCVRLLREFGDRVDLPADFTIFDTADQKRVMKEVLKQENISAKNFPPDTLLSSISNAKNELIDIDTYTAQAKDFYGRITARAYAKYQQLLTDNGAVDFDDLLMKTAELLRNDEATRTELQERFGYLLIDEYQDTNHAQFMIAHCIASGHGNICVVGDPDQSIYGWRGANIRNILEFEQHYPAAQVIELGQNYRSTPEILKAADTLIRHNKQRRHKPLFTENAAGQRIRVVHATDEEHEAQQVVDWLREHESEGGKWSEMVVFYRINALSRVIEDALLRSSIPYQVARGTAFYDRKEVRDAIAYLRVISNPRDEVALLRIINTPTRGIGNTTIEHLRAFAAANQVSLGDAIERASMVPALNPRAVAAVSKFWQTINQWRQKVHAAEDVMMFEPGIRDLVEMVIRDSGLEKYYEKEDEEKLANLYELVTAAQRFDDEYGEEDATLARRLADYLESIALVSDVDAVNTEAGAVTLMTLHAAKGLEFPYVAMLGLEEGLMPHSRSMDSPEEVEEERRLCFVGITRAERKLMLSHARYRTIRGMRDRTIPSPFLKELPEDVLAVEDLTEVDRAWDDDGGFRHFRSRSTPSASAAFDEDGDTGMGINIGQRVNHPQFGPGSVLSVTGTGGNARARVHFDRAGVKTLILEYARLEKIT
jgi:DNA helicase-2/ATP-dependent DNA helicase PcrA